MVLSAREVFVTVLFSSWAMYPIAMTDKGSVMRIDDTMESVEL